VTRSELRQLLGAIVAVSEDLATVSSILAASAPAATWDRARRAALHGAREIAVARDMVRAALDPAWCDGCGDGASGTMEHLTRGAIPCVVCNGGLALVDGAPADEGGA
jgi:hypothetical protein